MFRLDIKKNTIQDHQHKDPKFCVRYILHMFLNVPIIMDCFPSQEEAVPLNAMLEDTLELDSDEDDGTNGKSMSAIPIEKSFRINK